MGIPIRFLKLSYFFIKSKSNFRESLIHLYCNAYYSIRHSKIEILNGVVFLNCYTAGKLLSALSNNVKSKENMYKLINEMKILCDQNMKFEEHHKSLTNIALAKITLEDGKQVPGYHYTYSDNRNSIHATSNLPSEIHPSQEHRPSITSLIKEGATKPGIIISKNTNNITFYKR